MSMYKKNMCLIFVILLLGMVGSALADTNWTNGGGDRAWGNASNWSLGVPTTLDKAGIRSGLAAGPIIDSGTTAVANNVVCGDWSTVGNTLDMTGGTLTTGGWVILGFGANDGGTFTISGGTADIGSHLYVARAGAGTLDMTGGTININGSFLIASEPNSVGTVYLDGGTINSGALIMTSFGAMDITAGTLIVNGDATSTITGYIGNGWITAYGGASTLNVDYDISNPGKTTVVAIEYEKAYYPSPPNSATGVDIDADLGWTAGIYAVSHDVYFGTDPTPDAGEFMGNQTETTYNLPQLQLGTIYYWRIDEVDPCDPCSPWVGDVWSFTTHSGVPDILVGTYYYPWFDNSSFHGGNPPGETTLVYHLDPQVTPELGWYNQNNSSVISQHYDWARYAGIEFFVCSYWGSGSGEDNIIQNKMFDNPDRGDIKLCVFMEPRITPAGSPPATESEITAETNYLCDNYFDHPSYLHIDGKPVIFIYVTRSMSDADLTMCINAIRDAAINKGIGEVYIAGDELWKAPSAPIDGPRVSQMDAITNYDIYGNLNSTPFVTDSVLNTWQSRNAAWKDLADTYGTDLIPGISPGYNDRAVRVGHAACSRKLNNESNTFGSFFSGMIDRLPANTTMVAVNSWNEWHEDTQIEPTTVTAPTNADDSAGFYTEGLYYEGYGTRYLDILRDTLGLICGDTVCDTGEDQCNCPADCGAPPSTETTCDDGDDEDCDGDTDCDDSDCIGEPACPVCDDETCAPSEDQCNCPEDCGTPPSSETNCTDSDDEDCDGYTDCADADCSSDPVCSVPLEQNDNQDDKAEVKDGQKGAQSFKHGSVSDPDYQITKVELKMSRDSESPSEDLVFTIGTSVNGGTISGSTVNITASSVTNTTGGETFMDYTVTYSTPVGPLSPNTTYYLNFQTGGNGKAYFLGYNGSSDYSNGTYYKAGSNDSKDCYFMIFGNDISAVDVDPPTPNPATFAAAPSADSNTAISMTATTGSDASGPVEYYFDETSLNPGGTDSGWQTSPSYTDTGLTAETQYTYTVQMRDSAPTPNVGTASTPANATTEATPDTAAPTPNPATFASAPAAISDSAISMTATTGTDASGPVEYFFDETSGNPGGTDSGWQTSASYTDSGLNSSTQYTYTVQMRDSSPAQNTGTASTPANATTDDPPPDTDPPTPNPATFAVAPAADSDTAISMTATTGTDASGPVEYYFDETSGNPGGTDSGWQTSASYTDTGLTAETQYTYTVQMRDAATTPNVGTASSPANATTDPAPDTDPPTPNPATFAVAPAADSDTAISMTATTGTDASGPVEYFFDETSGNPGGTDSGWQTSASYTDSGLNASTQYTYTVTMRDALANTGTVSAPANATTDQETDPPTPNPATFAAAPAADSDTAISMTATTGSDASGPVEYLFTETSGNPGGTTSAWQTSTSYTDSGLNASTQYTYTVTMRDALANTGTASSPANATTDPPPDTDPPTPNPATFASAPSADSSSAISMTATTGSDASGPVQYYFDETSGNPGGSDSGWQTSASYTDTGLDADTQYTYTVQMRDSVPNTGTASSPASATTEATSESKIQYNNSGGNKQDVKDGQKGAQSWKHGSSGTFTVTKIVLHLSRESDAPNGALRVDIGTSVNGGAVSGSSFDIPQSAITNTSGGSSFMTYTHTYSTPVSGLSQGATYYLNLDNLGGNGKSDYVEYASGNTYSDGTYYKGGSNDGKDMWFEIWGY